MLITIMLSKWSHFKKLLCQLLCMMVVMTIIMNDNDNDYE